MGKVIVQRRCKKRVALETGLGSGSTCRGRGADIIKCKQAQMQASPPEVPVFLARLELAKSARAALDF